MDSPESPLQTADGITKYGHGKNSGFWLVHGSNGPYSNMGTHTNLPLNWTCVSTSKTIHSIRVQAAASALTLKKPYQVTEV